VDAPTPLGAQARSLYALFANRGHGALDFSAIIRMIAGDL
jgi:3-hydroxyisobutyrate dehydrogenase